MPASETPAAVSKAPSIVIERVTKAESVLYTFLVRNNGAESIDLGKYNLIVGHDYWMTTQGLCLVRGSLRLNAGETALVVAHPDVPTDDETRRAYWNVYAAIHSDGDSARMSGDGVRLVGDDGGVVAFGGGECELVGHCCSTTGTLPCILASGPSNDCSSGMTCRECHALTGEHCWKESSSPYCQCQGCCGSGWQLDQGSHCYDVCR